LPAPQDGASGLLAWEYCISLLIAPIAPSVKEKLKINSGQKFPEFKGFISQVLGVILPRLRSRSAACSHISASSPASLALKSFRGTLMVRTGCKKPQLFCAVTSALALFCRSAARFGGSSVQCAPSALLGPGAGRPAARTPRVLSAADSSIPGLPAPGICGPLEVRAASSQHRLPGDVGQGPRPSSRI